MADASRVGYRTNGLSSALQLHHLSSRVGQTDGIAPPGVHQRRKPMDHAIADSHAPVTISHSGVQESQDPQSVQCRARVLPGLLVLFWHEEGLGAQEPRKCGPSRLSALTHPSRSTPGSGPTSHADETSGTPERARNPKTGVSSNASSLHHTVRYVTPVMTSHPDRSVGGTPVPYRPPALHQPSVGRPRGRPVAAPQRVDAVGHVRSRVVVLQLTGRQGVHQAAVVQLDQ